MHNIYQKRRNKLRSIHPDKDILLLSSPYVPRNYKANVYPFHQDSTWRYFTGLPHSVSSALLLEADGNETLFFPAYDPDDLIWTGLTDDRQQQAEQAGVVRFLDIETLRKQLNPLHTAYIAPHDPGHILKLSDWLGHHTHDIKDKASTSLMTAIYQLRMHKDTDEIREIEEAVALSKKMLASAEKAIAAGQRESDITAALLHPAIAEDRAVAFLPIVTVRGERLHNEHYDNVLQNGDILLIDSGVESRQGYCSDITRCFAVSGTYTQQQQAIYDTVLNAQQAAYKQCQQSETTNLEVHLAACRAIIDGLTDVGLMCGNREDALAAGAHALFMPHGIGHALGLDVHDMENFGDIVGYAPGTQRSEQFGLNALRLARQLEPGFVITIEPGIYFIPELIRRWRNEKKHADFINYDMLESYMQFGGIRIEDDVLITDNGARILGPGIAK